MEFASDFETSSEIAVLPLTLYVIGLAFGSMIFAPLSEYYGRTPVYLVSFLGTALWLMATALVESVAGFMILRFITGLFCSASIGKWWHSRLEEERLMEMQ
jgi:MFS family permease